MSYKKVFLKPGKEESLKRFHPWVFSGAIARVEGEPEEGEVVDVYTSKKEFIACGHFQIGSIAVRVLSFRQEPIDHAFWVRRLQVAKDLRCALGVLGNPQNNTYRLVHGEGDNLPGLIIDVYDHTAVMQAHSAGMHLDRMVVAEALEEVMATSSSTSIINQKPRCPSRPTYWLLRTASSKAEVRRTWPWRTD